MYYLDKLASIQNSAVLNRIPTDANGFIAAQIAKNFQNNSANKSLNRDLLFIAKSDMEMEIIANQIKFFSPQLQILNFLAWDCMPFDRASPRMQIMASRIRTLHRLTSRKENENFLVITSVNAILQKILPPSQIKNMGISLQTGSKASITEVAEFLIKQGYERCSCANNVGEFAVRGGIIDIVILQAADLIGYRLDFFGEVIESIKIFDPISQISAENVKQIEILPSSEVILNKKTIENFCQNYRRNFGVNLDDSFYQTISEGRSFDGMEHWLPLFFENPLDSLFSYLNSPVIFVGDEILPLAKLRSEEIADYQKMRLDDRKISKRNLEGSIFSNEETYNPIDLNLLYFSNDWLQKIIENTATVELNRFDSTKTDSRNIDLRFKSVPDFALAGRTNRQDPILLMQEFIFSFLNNEELVLNFLPKSGFKEDKIDEFDQSENSEQKHDQSLLKANQEKIRLLFAKNNNIRSKKIAFATMSEGSLQRVKNLFTDFSLSTIEVGNFEELGNLKPGNIALLNMPLEMGFVCEDLLLISEQALFGEKIFRKKTSKSASRRIIEEAMSLVLGELVVHRDYGIGKFDGIQTISSGSVKTDMIKLLYAASDVLFVPVDEINLLSRYGAENALVQLDRLGVSGWKNRCDKVRKKIKLAAEELLKVAAARKLRKAPIFVPETIFYDEFKARFGFVETEDQMRAITEVEEDLRRGSPMDRLICGDVGFGKTEVAMRASAIICKDAQVAVVVPTTILSRQHFKNFSKRFEGTGVKIAQLSRLVSSSQAKQTTKEILSGEVRIIIGTHALLQKSIQFQNLGLVIIDEEQHFGVAQKERLKQLRSETHVLTLSATPIPRTLQMSLTGVKDLSLISTPPLDRLAVRNFSMPYDSVIVREAVMREYNRGGKVFFVVPRIKDIEDMEPRLKIILPELKITHAHGQMAPSQLDSIMNDFIDGKIDVLLSTTIIESGIDISTANTMIIYKAEMFGLAQLYQLRGRVGRGKLRGYCYFMLDNRKKIRDESRKKLEVMQNLDSLGIGFTVASHDMDIRGGGNVLGDEQSGHIKETGIELYQQMLLETIEKLKSDPEFFAKENSGEDLPDQSSSVKIKLGISLLIPENYISDLSLRMSFYRKISNLQSADEKESLINEMHDRFGKIPLEVFNLIEISLIKTRCQLIGVASIENVASGLQISFQNNHFAAAEKLMKLIFDNKSQIRLVAGQKIIFSNSWKNNEEKISFANQVLNQLESLIKD